jgi:hypothetical protein
VAFEDSIFRPVLLVHAVVGFSALAVALHLLVAVWRARRRGSLAGAHLHAGLLVALQVAALVTGALVYPAFRVHVRAAFMDATAPTLTGLFEIKEHWGVIAAFAAWATWRRLRGSAAPPPEGLSPHVALVTAQVLATAWATLLGLWLVSTRALG